MKKIWILKNLENCVKNYSLFFIWVKKKHLKFLKMEKSISKLLVDFLNYNKGKSLLLF